jgi:hypothetical protein
MAVYFEGDSITREVRLMSGIILISVPTSSTCGYFLLTSLMNKGSGYMETPFHYDFFGAGHAHAGYAMQSKRGASPRGAYSQGCGLETSSSRLGRVP